MDEEINKETGMQLALGSLIEHSIHHSVEVYSHELVDILRVIENMIAPMVQTMNSLLKKVATLEEHAQATPEIPESLSWELQRVSSESTAIR